MQLAQNEAGLWRDLSPDSEIISMGTMGLGFREKHLRMERQEMSGSTEDKVQ